MEIFRGTGMAEKQQIFFYYYHRNSGEYIFIFLNALRSGLRGKKKKKVKTVGIRAKRFTSLFSKKKIQKKPTGLLRMKKKITKNKKKKKSSRLIYYYYATASCILTNLKRGLTNYILK